MCGIVGYVGARAAAPVLLDGLARLEYRGYDSAGVAVQNGHGVVVRKLAGRVGALRDVVTNAPLAGGCGIGHTRWATHGAPTTTNAHPHVDCTGTLALVHNGIIENADTLRRRLSAQGHRFTTETDTEVLAHLIESAPDGPLEDRVAAALLDVVGTYGIAVMSAAEPGKLVAARRGSPVLLGVGAGESFIASDPSAICEHTKRVVYLNDGDLAVITPDSYRVVDREAHELERNVSEIEWDADNLELNGFTHFMLKEIHEQPRTIGDALRGRTVASDGNARLNGLNLSAFDSARLERLLIVGCGTSWHAGLVGRYVIERLAGIPVDVEYA